MHEPCAFHNQFMEQIRETLVDIKEQMRAGIESVNRQSIAFAENITKIVESQIARQVLCAKQDQRLSTLEQNQGQHRTDHATEREEHMKDRAEFWAAINKLRFHVYVGLGIGLTLQFLVPVLIRYAFKG